MKISLETLSILLLYSFHNTVNASVLTQYDGLEKDYWRWRDAPRPKDHQSHQITTFELDVARKRDLCHSFIEANNYVYLKAKMAPLNKSGKSKQTHLKDSAQFDPRDDTRVVKIGSKTDSLNTFQCVSDKENQHFFHLTYHGHRANYNFVISTIRTEKGEDAKSSVFQALLQPSATINETFLKEKAKLPLMFWKDLMQEETKLKEPIRKSLCDVNEYQHFNVCSVVADKLYRESTFLDFDEIQNLNYIHLIPYRCIMKIITDPRKKLPDKEREVVPCAINNENWSRPQFYLLRDTLSPDSPASVYVLKTKDEGKLAVFTKIDDVMPLIWA